MMKNLLLKEGEIIQVQYVNLDIARFAKFQPQSVDFLEISNPKAV
jgi:ubiquitin fusion degradation protein 1